MGQPIHPCSYKIAPLSSITADYHSSVSNIVDTIDYYEALASLSSDYANFWNGSLALESADYSTLDSLLTSSTTHSIKSKELRQNLITLNSIAYFYITPIIIIFGIVGDILSIAVLSHPILRKTSVVYSYLLALAVTDLLTLISVIPPILWIMKVRFCTLAAARYYAHVGFPLANAFMAASVYIVVFLTFNQFMAVCYPFLCTDFIRSRRNCLRLTLVAYALSFTLYIPWAWKKHVRYVGDLHSTLQNCPFEACDNHIVTDSLWYKTYQWTREVISRFIPFLFIAYFNLRILYVYRRTRTQRMNVIGLREQKQTLKQKTEGEQRRLWALLFGIMTLFFVCTIPAAPFTIMVSDRLESNLTFQTIRAVTNVLEFTKFALNFYLYCMVNPDIRRLCLKRLTCHTSLNGLRAPMVASRHSYHLSDLIHMNEKRCNLRQKGGNQEEKSVTRSASFNSSSRRQRRHSKVDCGKPLLAAGYRRNDRRHTTAINSNLFSDLEKNEMPPSPGSEGAKAPGLRNGSAMSNPSTLHTIPVTKPAYLLSITPTDNDDVTMDDFDLESPSVPCDTLSSRIVVTSDV